MEKLHKIEKPDITKIDISELLPMLFTDQKILEALSRTEKPTYLGWKDLKYKTWVPEQFLHQKIKFWALIKFHRKLSAKKTQICDSNGVLFTWEKLSHYEKMLHEMDLDMSNYLLNLTDLSEKDRKKYQLKGIMEEAIASSQLEGAHVTRKIAKEMIEEKRTPRTPDERMILNNFMTMKIIQEKYKDEKLTINVLFDLHKMLTTGTGTIKESEQGRFRLPSDKIVVQKGDDLTLISYVAPPIEFVEKEIKRFIDFANDELTGEDFIHPIIKAIMLHFWIGILHPFVDGNGRLARGLFYWYLLHKGYWAFAFLPISIAIKSAPAQYGDAYILSEQDDNNMTYFIDYHLRKIIQAVNNFKRYIGQKSQENQRMESMISEILLKNKSLNKRQAETLISFHQNPDRLLNVSLHTNIHRITKSTAIKDLRGLLKKGFVISERHGKNVFYTPTEKVKEMF